MKSKKFVLAGLALLAAITMVLLPLSGCKNDSVPETPAAKLVSISVTPPARTVYSVGDEVVHKKGDKIGVTAHYDNGTKRPVTGTITTDTSTLTESAGVQTVTVSYTEGETSKTTTFTVTVFPEEVKVLTGYTSPNHTGNEWTYVEFGEWPQTILKGDVEVDESEGKEMGMFTYYLGDDSNYYVKHSDKYYEVEPIVWRVLTTSYKAPEGGTAGNALLLAESILTGGVPYYVSSDTRKITKEKETGTETVTVYPNNWQYSTIRAWLNGSYEEKDDQDKTYTGKGFLQTAFTQSAWDKIADTSVDNSAASTTDAGSNLTQATDYACANTTDKVFLLSEEEATTLNSGFGAYNKEDSTRIRVTTDYAKATGAYQSSTGGWWWLRSPYYDDENRARYIYYNGNADNYFHVGSTTGGVVPALSISLQ